MQEKLGAQRAFQAPRDTEQQLSYTTPASNWC